MNRFVVLIFSIGTLLLTGCAGKFNPSAMAPIDYEPSKKHPYSVAINVGNLEASSTSGMLPVPNKDLYKAIEETIVKTGAFNQVLTIENADYELSVTVVALNQPSMGFSFTVKADLAWQLKRAGESTSVWRKMIHSEYTTGAGEAFAGAVRLRMATEGAVKNNIALAFEEIAKLEL